MNISIRAPLMADKIKDELDGKDCNGISFTFIEKKGMELFFSASGDGDAVAAAKKAIKDTDYGKGLYFSVTAL